MDLQMEVKSGVPEVVSTSCPTVAPTMNLYWSLQTQAKIENITPK